MPCGNIIHPPKTFEVKYLISEVDRVIKRGAKIIRGKGGGGGGICVSVCMEGGWDTV